MFPYRHLWFAIVASLCLPVALAAAPSEQERAQTIVHLLDYIAVDYPTFVRDGQVLDTSEYEEQREFAGQAVSLIEQGAATSHNAALVESAHRLQRAIESKTGGTAVAALAGSLRADVIRVFGVTVTPAGRVDLAAGAHLFETQCASCHGPQGQGDGAAAASMDPRPANFHNAARMDALTLYGIYNTITLGVNGTPMRPFSELSDSDRWALAFFVANLRTDPQSLAKGATLWKKGEGRAPLGTLKALVTTPLNASRTSGDASLASVQEYLTAHPEEILATGPAPIDTARQQLDDALRAYAAGDRERARQRAIGAYLEGFELIESSLDNVDAPLRLETERQMMAVRSMIGAGETVERVTAQVATIKSLLAKAEERLSVGSLSPTTAFASSLFILLREGLEAILVLSAIVAFVKKTDRRDALPYIHMGWLLALALGGLTWLIARYVLSISGANRELTEGITALIAAGMLLYVGYWLHSKSYAHAWQAFIREQVTTALGKRTLWAMAGISFLAVYRELFEIILFYEALWVQAGPQGRQAVLLGILAAAVLLAAVGGLILKYSVRLPIGPFFAWTSGVLAALAVVFAGNGIAALQEAGVVSSTAIHFVSAPLLGVYPTVQGLLVQSVGLLLVLGGVLMAQRSASRNAVTH